MPFLRSISIRNALILVVSIAILPSLGIILFSGFELGSQLEHHAHQEVMRQTRAFSEIQDNITGSTRGLLSSVARLHEFANMDSEGMSRILREIHIQNPYFVNLSFVDTNRVVRASSLLKEGSELKERLHIEEAFLYQTFRAGEYTIARVDEIPSLPFGMPVFDKQGNAIGVLTAIFRLEYYSSLYRQFSLLPDSFLGLVDSNGTRLFYYPSRETNPVGSRIKEVVWERIRSGPSEGFFTDTGSDGIERWFAYNVLYVEGDIEPYMYVVFAIPTEVSRQLVRSVIFRNLILMLGAVILSLFTVFLLSGATFGRRLSRILDAADRIREGDLSARVSGEDKSHDLGRIAHSLNLMAATVEVRHLELEETAERMAVLASQKELLFKELHHRVKNNLQLILSLIHITPETDPRERPLREALENRISAIALLHEMLNENEAPNTVDLLEYIRRIVDIVLGDAIESQEILCDVEGDSVEANLDLAVPFGLVLNEIITNSLKYGQPKEGTARISISLRYVDSGFIELVVRDNGPGILDTAKRPDGGSSGIGLDLVDILMQQLKGSWDLSMDEGAVFTLSLPIQSTATH